MRPRTPRAAVGLLVLVLPFMPFIAGCPDEPGEEDGDEPFFPADYLDSYVEVRDCRGSGDHDLNNIRILADPSALGPYQSRSEPFPVDAVVIKEEYDFGDQTCTGPIKQWTVMRRLPDGSAPATLDWTWQRVDNKRKVQAQDEPRCISCHQGCGVAPDGHDGTCAMP